MAAYDAVIREVQEKGIARDELDAVKVKFRSDYYSIARRRHGFYMPRFGLMHYLACFTLFDGDPDRVNTDPGRFSRRHAGAGAGRGAKNIWCRAIARSLIRRPVAKEVRDDAATASQDTFAASRSRAWARAARCLAATRTCDTLANGMQVVLAESRTFPKITGAALFSQRQCRGRARAPGPRGNDGYRGAHGHGHRAPAARSKRICAAWAPILARTPARTQARFRRSRPGGIFGASCWN